MIDFHTHILPCVDDGSPSISKSISMLRAEAKQGIDTVMLTPHYYAQENSPAQFLERRDRMYEKLLPYLWDGLPQIHLGAEVQYFEGICDVEDVDQLRLQGTDYLLVEMPFSTWSDRMVEDVITLSEREETTVVLAHIERYMAMQPKDIWADLKRYGILMQSNVSFFADWRKRRKAMAMLKQGDIHLLGSDCHNLESRRPNWDLLPDQAKWLVRHGPAYKELRRALRDVREYANLW